MSGGLDRWRLTWRDRAGGSEDAVLGMDVGVVHVVDNRITCWACLAQYHSAGRHGPADDSESTCRQAKMRVVSGGREYDMAR